MQTIVKPVYHPNRNIQVLVFKTNLQYQTDLRNISPVMSGTPGIIKWNVDQHDIDNVLRIETTRLLPEDIIRLVTNAGYACEELPD